MAANQFGRFRWQYRRIRLARRPCGDDGTCTWRRIHRDSGYLSLSEPVAFLGLRDSATPIDIEADRYEGGRERFAINATGTKLALVRGEGTALH